MRWLAYLFLAGCIAAAAAGCTRVPEFSTTPEVKILNVQLVDNTASPTLLDELQIELYFRDGDGDIGLGDSLKNGEFAKYLYNPALGKVDSSELNPLYDNLHVSVFFWKNGKFDSIPPIYGTSSIGTRIMQTRPYTATIKPITSRKEPIEGNLKYTLSGFFYADNFPFPVEYPTIKSGDQFYVRVQLFDRAKNSSRRLQSDLYTAP